MIKKQGKEVWKSTQICETVSTGHFSEKLTRKLRWLGGMSCCGSGGSAGTCHLCRPAASRQHVQLRKGVSWWPLAMCYHCLVTRMSRLLCWVGPAPAQGSCQWWHDRTGRCLWLHARPTLGIISVVPFNLGSILLNGFDNLEWVIQEELILHKWSTDQVQTQC